MEISKEGTSLQSTNGGGYHIGILRYRSHWKLHPKHTSRNCILTSNCRNLIWNIIVDHIVKKTGSISLSKPSKLGKKYMH